MIPYDVTTQGRPRGLRGKFGRLMQTVIPDLDQRAYARARRADVRARRRSGLNRDIRERYPAKFSRRSRYDVEAESHVVVVPAEGRESGTWAVAAGNFYFEVAENLKSHIGADRVSVLHIAPDACCATWHRELFDHLMDSRATHFISHIEHDPGSINKGWTWDSLWQDLSPRWKGVFLGSTFDASFRFTSAKARVLAQTSTRFMAVDVGLPLNGTLVKNQFEVGPVIRPMSPATLQAIRHRLQDVRPTFDVSFVGALYPYRVELIKQLESMGISIAVNPHKDGPLVFQRSHEVQPSWLDFLAGLRLGRATINFSRSSAGPIQQLKWRVVEAGLAGTYLVTDDQDQTSQFWPEDQFSVFDSPSDLPMVLESLVSEPSKLSEATASFAERASFLSQHQYWGAIEHGLNIRGLPGVGVAPFVR